MVHCLKKSKRVRISLILHRARAEMKKGRPRASLTSWILGWIWYLDQSKETLYLYHPDINKWRRKEGVSTQASTYEAIKAGRALEKPKTLPLRKGWGVLVDKMTEANNHQCIH